MRTLGVLVLIVFSSLLPAQTPPGGPTANLGSPCDIGADPAATLLVPYFEVDSSRDDGPDTLVGIVNLDDDPTVAHVVVWNVDAWAVFEFNIYLTGFDVTTFSMRDILVRGQLPNNGCTSSVYRFITRYIDCDGDGMYFKEPWTQNDGLISLSGSNWDVACYATVPTDVLSDRQCKLSIGSYDGWNTNFVGYLTIDNTITCSGGLPDYDGWPYFAVNYLDTDGDGMGDHGVIENSNVLLGDILYYDQAGNQSDGVPAVHIEALGEENALAGHTWGWTSVSFQKWGLNTFWYKYEQHAGLPPWDARETLPVRWAFRYIGNTSFSGETWVDVWRSHNPAFEHWWVPDGPCIWPEPLGAAYSVLYNAFAGRFGLPPPGWQSWDEDGLPYGHEGPTAPPEFNFSELILAAQRTEVSYPNWPLVDEAGWMILDFRTDAGYGFEGFGNAFDQSWVNVRYRALRKYSVNLSATAVMGGCALKVDPPSGMLFPVPTH